MKRKRCSNDDVVPSSTASSSSDITDPSPSTKYDVFLSFRGEDTRDGFTSHLYEAMCRKNIKTFIDDQLEKGKKISPDLLETIEKSEIYVIIFSKDYASSTWCLDELVNILECKEKYGRIVIPVFYKVDPSNIRKQSGSFKKSFIKHEQRFNNNMGKVQRWKDALTQAANLSGLDSTTTRPESRLVREIVKNVLKKLDHNPSYSLEGLVGIQCHIFHVEELLSLKSLEVVIVGIWGMGGTGKTTLAKLLYQKLKANFESCSLIENAREQLKRDGLNQLQSQCLLELLDDGDIGTCDIKSSYVKTRLQRKRILLVLDDVDNYIRVEDLIKLRSWFGRGSRIIITSRDKQVLKNAKAYRTYLVKEMNSQDALQLFSLEAFKENEPTRIFVELSKQVVNYCQGIPLALKVWGNFLHDRRKEEWENALEKLKQAPHTDIFNVLKISFDGLDDKQKNIFLDLSCFFGERYNLFMKYMGDFYDFPIEMELRVLIERSLISVDDGVIIMHDLMRAMGREIVHQQFSEPRKSIRLWKHEDIYDVFKNNKETEMIHGICLDMSSTKNIHLKANAFQKMDKVRFLKFYKSNGRSNLFLLEDLDILPEELRFLCWEDYSLSSIPLHFCAKKLVELIMPYSRIKKLWDGDQLFPNLKRINLCGSELLVKLPDLSQTPNLEIIYLFGCKKLVQVHSSTIMPKLQILGLDNCNNRRRVNLAGNNDETTLALVAVYNCFDLDKFSLIKVTVKVFTSDTGKISSFKFKAEWAPFTEILGFIDNTERSESKLLGQRSASLLPFVCKLRWLDIPIEFGHFQMHFSSRLSFDLSRAVKTTNLRWEMPQPTIMEFENSENHFEIEHATKDSDYDSSRMRITSSNIIELGQSLVPPRVKVLNKLVSLSLEEWGYKYNRRRFRVKLDPPFFLISDFMSFKPKLRVPKSICRWSLLTDLSLQKSDIVRVTCSIHGLSTLKSIAQCDSLRLQPIADLTFSMNKGMGALEFFMISGFNASASYYDSGFLSFLEGVISFSLVEDTSKKDLRDDDEQPIEDSWKEIVRQLMRERTESKAI